MPVYIEVSLAHLPPSTPLYIKQIGAVEAEHQNSKFQPGEASPIKCCILIQGILKAQKSYKLCLENILF